MMKLFIDTANVAEIREAWDMGMICGVTTNPSLIAREGADLEERMREILSIVTDGPINGEAIGTSAEELTAGARKLARIDSRIVVKVPMTQEGLKAIRILKAEGIKTNATLVFSAAQGLLAARAGASYISPFLGRLDDIGQPSEALLEAFADIWSMYDLETEIIAASIRSPEHVVSAARLGIHIATVPYKILLAMTEHPLTDAGIKRFDADWQDALKKRGQST